MLEQAAILGASGRVQRRLAADQAYDAQRIRHWLRLRGIDEHIELLCAAQALEQHRPLRSGHTIEAAYARLRARVPALDSDRPPAPDIAALAQMIAEGAFED